VTEPERYGGLGMVAENFWSQALQWDRQFRLLLRELHAGVAIEPGLGRGPIPASHAIALRRQSPPVKSNVTRADGRTGLWAEAG
jgi:hypothetical protein